MSIIPIPCVNTTLDKYLGLMVGVRVWSVCKLGLGIELGVQG